VQYLLVTASTAGCPQQETRRRGMQLRLRAYYPLAITTFMSRPRMAASTNSPTRLYHDIPSSRRSVSTFPNSRPMEGRAYRRANRTRTCTAERWHVSHNESPRVDRVCAHHPRIRKRLVRSHQHGQIQHLGFEKRLRGGEWV
jgi:hypothetical protein